MKSVARVFVLLSLVVAVAVPLNAGDKDKKAEVKKGDVKKGDAQKEGKKGAKRPSLAQQTLKRFAKAELTEEQVKKIQDLAAEHGPKIQAARKKYASTIPKEQRKARAEAIKKARAEGKKLSDVVTAFKPTPEQAEARKQLGKVQGSFFKAVNQLLTPEQRQKIRPKRKDAADKKPKLKKGEGKKPAEKTPAKKAAE